MHGWRPIRCACRQYSTKAPRAVRGMADRFGTAERKHQHIVAKAQETAERYGYDPVHTPVLEYSSVFERTLGADSDVVGKELYKFLDSSEHWMTMRPEGTAGVARALITNKLEHTLPQRLFYAESMFRHERPQKGRLRQFEQFGIELVGIAHPAADVECIQMGWEFLSALDIGGSLELRLNTLGDFQSRSSYRESLKQYFTHYFDKLSEDSRRRLQTNPMRILDSKDEADISVAAAAPVYDEHLSSDSRAHFAFVKDALGGLGIPFTIDSKLVRGLDYYQHTVWEIACASDALGRSQATVLAGGRYDGLTSILGGSRQLPGVGWASGIERLALVLADSQIPLPTPPIPVLIIPDRSSDQGKNSREVKSELYTYAMRVAQSIREHHSAFVLHSTVANDGRPAAHQPLSKQLAGVLSRQPAPTRVAIVGSEEMKHNQVIIRDTSTQAQQAVLIEDIGKSIH